MLKNGQSARTGLLVLSLVCLFGTTTPLATGNIVLSDLKGSWRIALRGNTDCGFSSARAVVTQDTTGTGTATLQIHGECGDSTLTNQTFTVTSLAKTGKGAASLTCGTGCTWDFEIQVAPDRSKFNLVDISPTNPGVSLDGFAILGSPAENIVIADLKGEWQVTAFGQYTGICGGQFGVWAVSVVSSLTMNATGEGTTTATNHTSCDRDIEDTGSLTFLSLSADGSGTAVDDDGSETSFQVSPDRSMINFVSLSPGQIFLAGVAIRRSTAGHIVKANLAGDWQVAIGGAENDGDCNGAARLRFTLNAKGVATNAPLVYHDECEGDGALTFNVKILTLNADGSGTLRITCGDDCEGTARIQVSPDRSTFSLVDVTAPGEFTIGTAIHQ